jgi:hypothetical protein
MLGGLAATGRAGIELASGTRDMRDPKNAQSRVNANRSEGRGEPPILGSVTPLMLLHILRDSMEACPPNL